MSRFSVKGSGQSGDVTTTGVTLTLGGKGQSVWIESVGGGDLIILIGGILGDLTLTNGSLVADGKDHRHYIPKGITALHLKAIAGTVTYHVVEDVRA